jgi:UDP-2,3-diacylglucosamine hydrolase
LHSATEKTGKKIYFASDFHLGIPDHDSSLKREKKLVSWLGEIEHDALEIYLMGDIFDFWFEYKTVVPKGFVRLLGKIAHLTESGIPVHLFTGNHDIWAFGYLEKELNMKIHRHPETTVLMGKQFYLAHGDGLGPGDKGYKLLKKVFSNRFNQWLFRWLHPDIGAAMALYFSRKSRLANVIRENKPDFVNRLEDLMLYKYAEEMVSKGSHPDYFIFGHLHTPTDEVLSNGSRLVILGDWLTNFTYAEFDGKDLKLKRLEN